MKPEMWIDANGCPEHYHEFRREGLGGPLKVYHVDGAECKEAEFNFWPNSRKDGE